MPGCQEPLDPPMNLAYELLVDAIGCIAYLRNFFPKASFTLRRTPSENSQEDKLRSILRVANLCQGVSLGADALLQWLEQGVKPLLDAECLHAISLGVYVDKNQPDALVERYTFTFNTKKHDEGGTGMRGTYFPGSPAPEQLLRKLILDAQTFEAPPSRKFLSMKVWTSSTNLEDTPMAPFHDDNQDPETLAIPIPSHALGSTWVTPYMVTIASLINYQQGHLVVEKSMREGEGLSREDEPLGVEAENSLSVLKEKGLGDGVQTDAFAALNTPGVGSEGLTGYGEDSAAISESPVTNGGDLGAFGRSLGPSGLRSLPVIIDVFLRSPSPLLEKEPGSNTRGASGDAHLPSCECGGSDPGPEPAADPQMTCLQCHRTCHDQCYGLTKLWSWERILLRGAFHCFTCRGAASPEGVSPLTLELVTNLRKGCYFFSVLPRPQSLSEFTQLFGLPASKSAIPKIILALLIEQKVLMMSADGKGRLKGQFNMDTGTVWLLRQEETGHAVLPQGQTFPVKYGVRPLRRRECVEDEFLREFEAVWLDECVKVREQYDSPLREAELSEPVGLRGEQGGSKGEGPQAEVERKRIHLNQLPCTSTEASQTSTAYSETSTRDTTTSQDPTTTTTLLSSELPKRKYQPPVFPSPTHVRFLSPPIVSPSRGRHRRPAPRINDDEYSPKRRQY